MSEIYPSDERLGLDDTILALQLLSGSTYKNGNMFPYIEKTIKLVRRLALANLKFYIRTLVSPNVSLRCKNAGETYINLVYDNQVKGLILQIMLTDNIQNMWIRYEGGTYFAVDRVDNISGNCSFNSDIWHTIEWFNSVEGWE